MRRFGKTFWLEARREGQQPGGALLVTTVGKSVIVREIAGEEMPQTAAAEETPGQSSSSGTAPPASGSASPPASGNTSPPSGGNLSPPVGGKAAVDRLEIGRDAAETTRRMPDGMELELSEEAPAAKARGIPDMPPLPERQQHRLLHLPYRSWCKWCVMGRGREERHV